MAKHRGIPAAEKYAELESAGHEGDRERYELFGPFYRWSTPHRGVRFRVKADFTRSYCFFANNKYWHSGDSLEIAVVRKSLLDGMVNKTRVSTAEITIAKEVARLEQEIAHLKRELSNA